MSTKVWEAQLRDRAADWARVAVPRLLDTDDPELDGLSARQVDIWGPLFAIADYCGGDWPTKARSSALALHRERGDSTDGRDAGVALLADLRELFDSEGAEFIRSSRLAELLRMQEDRPWPEFTRGGTISTSAIARLLKPYGIVPRQERIGGEKCRAYWFADCREPFKRYLPPREAGTVGTPGTVGAFVQTVPTAPAIRQGVPQFDDVVLNDKGYPADWDTPAIAAA